MNITISQALNYAARLKDYLAPANPVSELRAREKRGVMVTSALSRDAFYEQLNNEEHHRLIDDTVRDYEKACGILNNISFLIQGKNMDAGVASLMIRKSLCARKKQMYEQLVAYGRQYEPLSYEEYVAQLTEESRLVSVERIRMSDEQKKRFQAELNRLTREMNALEQQIATKNHTITIEIPDEDAAFVENLA